MLLSRRGRRTDVPHLINYQGKLTKPNSVPIQGNTGVGLGLYTAPIAAYVEKVYEYGDFSALGIGT